MACTETGLKTCERPAVLTLKPLKEEGEERGEESERVADYDGE